MNQRNQSISDIGRAIRKRNEEGFLGFVPCFIPGFPDVRTSQAAMKLLDNAVCVTGFEITLPASRSFSATANQVIVDSNKQAYRANPGGDIEWWLNISSPRFIMFYKSATEEEGFENLVKRFARSCSGILLEWEEPDLNSLRAICNAHTIELITIVVPDMTGHEIDEIMPFVGENGLVYFECSTQAGGRRATPVELGAQLRRIKEWRPNSVVIASMGIRTPEDIREIGGLPGVNGVAVGTAFFEATKAGLPTLSAYLASLEPALRIERRKEP